MEAWTPGDVSGLEALTDEDHLYPSHINELRADIRNRPYVTVGTEAPADYICNGVDDDVEIQAAIDAAYTAGGGTVFIREGTYLVSSSVLYRDNVTLRGAGRHATIIKLEDGNALTGAQGIVQHYNRGKFVANANQVLLLHFDGEDEAQQTQEYESDKAVTFVADAQIDTAQKVFGSASLLLDGIGDAVSLVDSADWYFAGGDFTIDLRVRFAVYDGVSIYTFASQHEDNDNRWVFYLTGTTLTFLNEVATSVTIEATASWTPVVDTWYHVALTRDGSNFRFFVDGTQVGSTTVDADPVDNNTGLLRIGANYYNATIGNAMNGWIDEFRILKGEAAWTANFTPPTTYYTLPIEPTIRPTLKDFSVDGNRDNNAGTYEGIVMLDVKDGLIDNCEVYECTEVGINAAARSYYYPNISAKDINAIVITNCFAHDNTSEGYQIGGGVYSHCVAHDNAGGFMIVSAFGVGPNSVCSITGCVAHNNHGWGIGTYFQYDQTICPTVIDGCLVTRNHSGVILFLANTVLSNSLVILNEDDGVKINEDSCIVTGNIIKNNGGGPYHSVSWGKSSGITIQGDPTDLIITNNKVYDDQTTKTQDYGITHIGTTSLVRCLIEGNNLYDNKTGKIHAGIVAAGANIRNNHGFVTENSGTATVANGTTAIVVTHGLSVTPTADDITVTPTNSMGSATKFYIGTFTSTQFTITVDANPGATTATFAWKAIVL